MKKLCNKCKEELLLSEFGKQKGGKFGLNGRCKKCIRRIQKERYSKDPETIKENQKRYHNKYPDAKIRSRLKYFFKFTLEEYNEMLEKQDNKCAICKIDVTRLNRMLDIDHCHDSGKIRGLLCPNCNKSLGLLKDNVETLQSAIKYLLK